MRTITNDYKDTQTLNLGSAGERGPYLVTETRVAPSDPLLKICLFVYIRGSGIRQKRTNRQPVNDAAFFSRAIVPRHRDRSCPRFPSTWQARANEMEATHPLV
jgi:hypothetical protein